MGNLFFGFFLALVGESANLTGLPLDVRHVAFSTANAGMGIVVTDPGILAHAWLGTVSGIVAIGAINLTVSFWLALNVAMLSRNFDVQSGRRRRESPSMPGS
jgi:site-specific recombinase